MNIEYMAKKFEDLALKFAPQLYYKESRNPFENISPEDMGGVYWRPIENGEQGTVCIQYIVYFAYQHWVPGILDKFSGKLPGEHPNDYVPIFCYFEDEEPVKAIFDICHYEAVGGITGSSELLPQDEGPQFHIRNFYRGLLPLENKKGYEHLEGVPISLSQEHLTEWWNGLTASGSYDNKAELIIRKKLENPFQIIKTFRDRAGTLGLLFDWVFQARTGAVGGLTITRTLEEEDISQEDFDGIAEFVEEHIFDEPGMSEDFVLR